MVFLLINIISSFLFSYVFPSYKYHIEFLSFFLFFFSEIHCVQLGDTCVVCRMCYWATLSGVHMSTIGGTRVSYWGYTCVLSGVHVCPIGGTRVSYRGYPCVLSGVHVCPIGGTHESDRGYTCVLSGV
eukprot:Rmarinus@m.4526